MLAAIGVPSVDALLEVIPPRARRPALGVPPGLSELEVARELDALAARDRPAGRRSLLPRRGLYRRYIPAAVPAPRRGSEFLTAYTPYQPRGEPGHVQRSGSTSRSSPHFSRWTSRTPRSTTGRPPWRGRDARGPRHRAGTCRRLGERPSGAPRGAPHVRARAGLEIVEVADDRALAASAAGAACLVTQSPSFFGDIRDLRAVAEAAHAAGALAVASVDPVACAILEPPGACGIDIAIGDGQGLGIPLSFGGPSVGLMAVRASLVRRLPGRIAGATSDARGVRGFVNTLQTREQHIRREKATSNICTNEAVYAIHAASTSRSSVRAVSRRSPPARWCRHIAPPRGSPRAWLRRDEPGPFLWGSCSACRARGARGARPGPRQAASSRATHWRPVARAGERASSPGPATTDADIEALANALATALQ